MNDLIKIDDITLAIKLLKDGEILVNKKQNKLTYFAFKKDKIHCQNSSLSFNISIQDFKSIYKDAIFYIYNFEDNSIDLKKDEEYYSWDVLKK